MEIDPAAAEFLSVMAPGLYYSSERRLASPPRPETFNTDGFFNHEPPSAMISFIIGGVLWVISFGMFIYRVNKLKSRLDGELKGNDLIRAHIACAIDNDSPYYTITSFTAISFLFLGGIQTDYHTTLIFMIAYYAVVSFGETLRVLLVYWSYKSLREVAMLTETEYGLIKSKKDEDEQKKDKKFATTEIQPTNIYADIGRERIIVYMIFITQLILVTFVSIDIYRSDTVRCMDGTPNCPVAMTAGSYGFYIIGIFQACVYLLGPKTSFGQSEQDPEFWLILLLASKKNGARLLWENPLKDPFYSQNPGTLRDSNGNYIMDGDKPKLYHQRLLNPSDTTIWWRFFMSYLVNGVAFHILVHALPIQVASQNTFTGVVSRAVGMLYLVDLDDSKGFKLIIAEKDDDDEGKKVEDKKEDGDGKEETKDDVEQVRPPGEHTPLIIDPTGSVTPMIGTEADQQAMAAEVNAILQEAQMKLELLRQHGPTYEANIGGGGRQSLITSARMRKQVVTNHINLISFGCKPAQNLVAASHRHSMKKNSGQVALLQVETGAELHSPGGALAGESGAGAGGDGDGDGDGGNDVGGGGDS